MARSSKLLGLGAMLALGSGAAAQAENLDAGKSAAALFAATCQTCHSSPRGLAKDRGSGGLESYLQEHYTSSPQSAAALAAYLIANPGNPRAKQAPVARNPAAPEEGSSKQGEAKQGEAKTERQTRAPHSTTMRPDSMIEPEQKRANTESPKAHGKRQQTKQEAPGAPAASSAEPPAAASAQPAAPAAAPAAAPVASAPPAQDPSAFSAPSP